MIIATDVQYDDTRRTARAAALGFTTWEADHAESQFIAELSGVAPYVPGQFYLRELPCLQAVLAQVTGPISTVIVDGHVWLGERPGLGHFVWTALGERCPVLGVAKSRYHSGGAEPVLRGQSLRPLYVSSVGIPTARAIQRLRSMHGPHRIPTLLKQVDQLARRGVP